MAKPAASIDPQEDTLKIVMATIEASLRSRIKNKAWGDAKFTVPFSNGVMKRLRADEETIVMLDKNSDAKA